MKTEMKSALIRAVENDNEEEIKRLTVAGVDVNENDDEGKTAIYYANKKRNIPMVCQLICAGSLFNINEIYTKEVMFYAIEHKIEEVVKKLIDAKVAVDETDNRGINALFQAVFCCNETFVRFLVEKGKAFVNARDLYGRTPLFYAITKSKDITQYLIQKGGDLKLKDFSNRSVLSFFVESCVMEEMTNPLSFANLLSTKTAEFNMFSIAEEKQLKHYRKTICDIVFCKLPLMCAIETKIPQPFDRARQARQRITERFSPALKEALSFAEGGSDIIGSILKNWEENKPFTTAFAKDVIVFLVERGSNPKFADSDGNTAIHYATCLPWMGVPHETVKEICEKLQSFGVPLDKENYLGQTPLLLCLSGSIGLLEEEDAVTAMKTLVEVCKFLVIRGSRLEKTTKDGESVLHLVIKLFQQGFEIPTETVRQKIIDEIMKLLQSFSCDRLIKGNTVNRRDSRLNSPLHCWASITLPHSDKSDDKSFETLKGILEYLLQIGAALNARNRNEKTPLHQCKTRSAIKLLLDKGANTKDLDSPGRSPLFYAVQQSNNESVVRALIAANADVNIYCVLVSGFSDNCTKDALEMYFENARRSGGGEVTDVEMKGDKAVVAFASPDVAKRVLTRKHEYQGCQLTVEEYMPSTDECASVLVSGLSDKCTKDAIEMFFENARRSGGGDVNDVGMKGDKAVVTFASSDVAKRVLARSPEYQGCQLTVEEYQHSTDENEADLAMSQQRRSALPLVLHNDCTWYEQTGEYRNKTGTKRSGLAVVQKALERLREIKGPVCVVSVAGPCRNGKSYVLSKAFEQGEVFPLGHLLDPETMGIWLWVVPQKFQDSKGRDFTVLLLDSEGTDSPNAKKRDDYDIFTLSVLLSSILIYNSVGVANRSDLENLDFITKLSQQIQLRACKNNKTDKDERYFNETFPNFIWLLRDVAFTLPQGCNTTRDYLLKNVLNTKGEAGSSEKALNAADSILNFFSGFDAFSLPSPGFDPKVVQNLNDMSLESQINPKFLEGIEEFKAILHPKLAPKKSINEGEFVTGEALATLVELYVEALNTPGVVPNVENAWDLFVRNKCTEVLAAAVTIYKQEMTKRMKDKIPCEADVIRKAHEEAVDVGLVTFRSETYALSTKHVEKYLTEFRNKTEVILEDWIQENKRHTEVYCRDLLKRLKKEILNPVLARLRGPEADKMKFEEIDKARDNIKENYESKARGAKDVQARVLLNFIPELIDEMKPYEGILQCMKGYNEKIEREKANRIIAEEQQRRFEEIIANLKEENKNIEKQMILMQGKQKEDMIRMQQVYEQRANEQQMQMANMMKANFEERRQEKEEFIRQHEKAMTQKQQEIQCANARISNEKKQKEIEIEKSSEPWYMKIIAPLATVATSILAAVVPKPCSIM